MNETSMSDNNNLLMYGLGLALIVVLLYFAYKQTQQPEQVQEAKKSETVLVVEEKKIE